MDLRTQEVWCAVARVAEVMQPLVEVARVLEAAGGGPLSAAATPRVGRLLAAAHEAVMALVRDMAMGDVGAMVYARPMPRYFAEMAATAVEAARQAALEVEGRQLHEPPFRFECADPVVGD